ncbi:right-handed parallel beta-helix repeat-containing protein [Nonomuraea sp. NPDC046802]|uniref:right-handed parallel beta-helix repeat-containing protein n=1 Tax=Nonomuraea sp. NPDC046802 TaxID=3154919 RepID=UPI0033EA28F9
MSKRVRPRLIGSILLTLTSAVYGTSWTAAQAAAQATYYASPTGSGSTCSQASPCSITAARDKVRTVNANMTGDIVVYLLPGDYHLDSTIAFNETDSGTNGYNVSYRSQGGTGAARLLGGKRVTGWAQYSGNIYRAQVGTSWGFDDLFENEVRAVKARTPNVNTSYGASSTSQGPYLFNEAYDNNSHTVFQYRAGDVNPAGWNLSGMQAVVYSGGHYNWISNIIPIAGVDAANRRITLSQSTDYPLTANGRYFVQGDLSLLDSPGEYYLDKAGGYLYYYPRATPIADQNIVAPVVHSILSFAGSSESAPVHNIVVDGLTLEYSDWVGQNPGRLDAMIFMRNTRNMRIENNHLKNAGLNGVLMAYYNKANTLTGNWIENVGISGIDTVGYRLWETNRSDVNRDHVISDNKIAWVGMHSGYSSGIYLMQSGHNVVTHNQISRGPRYLIGAGGDTGASAATNYFENNYFGYNDLANGSEDTADAAPFYFVGTVTSSEANTVEQLRVDGANWSPYSGLASPTNIKLWGVYFDNESSYWTVRNVALSNIMQANDGHPNNFLANGSSNHTISNASWASGFDPTKMDNENIGLLPEFPPAYGNGGYTWGQESTCTGGWNHDGNVPGAYNGDELSVYTPGVSNECTFTGTEVKWASKKFNLAGKADVYIDGVLDATVDLYSANPLLQHVVYVKRGLSAGRHTIKIVVRSDRNAASAGNYVVIDTIGAK